MKSIDAFAHILMANGSNSAGMTFSLEVFILTSQSWKPIVSAKTNGRGVWRAKTGFSQNGSAPQLRLTEPKETAASARSISQVLAQNSRLSYNSDKQILSVDFGTVARLEEASFTLKASSAKFRKQSHVVAGQLISDNISTLASAPISTTRPGIVGPAAPVKPGGVDVERYNAELIKFKAIEADLQRKITSKDQVLKERNEEVSVGTKRITLLESQLAKSTESETKLKRENEVFVAEAIKKVPLQNIAAKFGAGVDAANKKMLNEKQPYRFGKVELDIKGTLGNDGDIALINLVDMEKIAVGSTIPGLKMELIPQLEALDSETSVQVPNVTGLTETVVRRTLHEVGLRLEVVNKSVDDKSNLPIGQSISQAPRAGVVVQRADTVYVVFPTV
jgi:hypothetical protein